MVGEPGDLSPPSRCPGLRRDSEPGSGNNSTLDNLFLPRFLGPMVNSDLAVHNPPAPLGWDKAPDPPLECLRKPPASPIDALMTSAAPKDTPKVETALNRL